VSVPERAKGRPPGSSGRATAPRFLKRGRGAVPRGGLTTDFPTSLRCSHLLGLSMMEKAGLRTCRSRPCCLRPRLGGFAPGTTLTYSLSTPGRAPLAGRRGEATRDRRHLPYAPVKLAPADRRAYSRARSCPGAGTVAGSDGDRHLRRGALRLDPMDRGRGRTASWATCWRPRHGYAKRARGAPHTTKACAEFSTQQESRGHIAAGGTGASRTR